MKFLIQHVYNEIITKSSNLPSIGWQWRGRSRRQSRNRTSLEGAKIHNTFLGNKKKKIGVRAVFAGRAGTITS
jgi:hypothetical protein